MEAQRGTSVRTWMVRLLFLGVIVALPLELAALRWANEPYPALYLPSFASGPPAGGTWTRTDPIVRVEFADGGAVQVDYTLLLPESQLHPRTVFNDAYSDEERANRPEVVSWLRELSETQWSNRQAESVVVEWTRREFSDRDFESGRVISVRTVVIDLTGQP